MVRPHNAVNRQNRGGRHNRRRVERRARAEKIAQRSLAGIAASRDPATAAAADETLRRRALRADMRRLSLLDATGRRVAGSPVPGGAPFPDLPAEARDALRSGRAVSGAMEPLRGGDQAQIAVYAPLLDGSGRLVAVLRAVVPVPELGRFETGLRLVLAVQVAGVLVILGGLWLIYTAP